MNKVYCNIVTPSIARMARQLKIGASYACNLVSTWQSRFNMPGVEPSVEALREFMNQNRQEMEDIELATPVYQKVYDSGYYGMAIANVAEPGKLPTIELHMFPKGFTLEQLYQEIHERGFDKYRDVLTDFKSYYAFQLYAAKLAVNRGQDSDYMYLPTEEAFDYAAQLLRRAKKKYPDVFGRVENKPQRQQPSQPVTQQPIQNTSNTVNIWAGHNLENAHLSNMAIRPFTYNGEQFNSVEQAFQSVKVDMAVTYGDITQEEANRLKDKIKRESPFKARSIGKSGFRMSKSIKKWDESKRAIMRNLIKASFEQNPQAKEALLATGNSQLTHNQDDSEWKTEFPKLLTSVRSELRNEGNIKYENHSGGAKGSDSYWGEVGELYGVTSNHYYDGEKTLNGNRQISEEDRIEGQQKATEAARQMYGLRGEVKNPLLIRDWAQVKYADAVYAIGTIIQPGDKINDKPDDSRTAMIPQVKSGTGYAVQMAVIEGKPVFVFDQEKNQWFTYEPKGRQFVPIGYVPRLTPNFAGIGTRELNDNGIKAIEDVYEATFGYKLTPSQSQREVHIANNNKGNIIRTLGDDSNVSNQNRSQVDSQTNTTTSTQAENESAPEYVPREEDVPNIGNIVEVDYDNPRAKATRDFTSFERTARIERISRRFSEIVDEMVDELIAEEQEKYDEAEGIEKDIIGRSLAILQDPIAGRRVAIQKIQPKNIYKRIKEEYQEYANYDEADFEEMYGEGTGAIIKDKYQKIVDNFEVLFNDACFAIENAENIRIVIEDKEGPRKSDEELYADVMNSTSEDNNNEEEFGDDEEGNRVTGNEGWSFKVRYVDPHSTLSSEVKRALHDIKRLNPDGSEAKDDLGNNRYLDEQFIHAVLLDKLSGMIDSDDFSVYDSDGNLTFPALEKIKERDPWIQQIINKLKADDRLASLFFADFRKDYISYWKQKYNDKKGIYESFPLNQPIAMDSTFTTVINNYDQGAIQDSDSIFDTSRRIKSENIDKGLELIDEIFNKIQDFDEDELDGLSNDMLKVLRMIGFSVNDNTVKAILKGELGIIALENVTRYMSTILESAKDIEEGTHLIDALKSTYKKIAAIVGEVNELNNVSSFREGSKTYPSYSAPNYVDTMFKLFKSAERRQSYIDNQFKSYDWFYDKENNSWNNEWMRLLEEDEDVQDKLELKEINNLDGIEYTEWEPNQIKTAFVLEYFAIEENKGSKNQFAWYNFPIFSDSPVVKFIKFIRYTTDAEGHFKDKILPLMRKIVDQELWRIKLVEDRAKAGVKYKIQNFDKVGNKFHFFPELNDVSIYMDEDGNISDRLITQDEADLSNANGINIKPTEKLNFIKAIERLTRKKNQEAVNNFIYDNLISIMDNNFNKFLNNYGGSNLTSVLVQQGIAATEEGAMEKLEEYFWNQNYATSQIIQLTTTDLAFYKNGTDFQKRYKEIYAAGTKLNTNSKYGRKIEKTIYLADQIITSATYLDIKKNLTDAYNEGRLSKMDMDSILYKFRNINVADAQAMRSISSYRAVLDMMGLWTDKMEEAVNRFEEGNWDMSDFNVVWQTIKPFVYTQLDKPDGLGGRIKVPHQNKNSEFLLLATYSMIANRIGKSPKIRAINRFMEDNGIDVSQFESSVKAGGQGIIDISYSKDKLKEWLDSDSSRTHEVMKAASRVLEGDKFDKASDFEKFKAGNDWLLNNGKLTQEEYNKRLNDIEPTEEEVYQMLEEATKNDDGSFIEEVVHEMPYSDYVVQQPTPEHLFDVEAVFGSQFRNLIVSDMPEDIEIEVNGKKIKGKQNILNLYQSLIVENLLEDYQKLSNRFATIQDLQKAMLETVKGNPKYGRDMLDALEIVEYEVNGEKVEGFNLPLHTPSFTTKIQELVNAMFKNAITKQHINGGNAILVSDFGFTEELQILKNSDGSIKGCECYMPFYTKKYFQPFLKDVRDNSGKVIGQEVDIEAIRKNDPELLKMVGYRIPTEGKYSMLPLIIKGFLPQQNGSTIMLPADVTQIAGSDFDIDKLFLMIPEFTYSKQIDRKALEDAIMANPGFRKWRRDNVRMTIDMIVNGKIMFDDNSPEEHIYDFYADHKDEFTKDVIRKVRYNNDRGPQGNNRAARNNMIIDIAYGILTHKSTAEKINNPGSFDRAKLAARRATIVNDPDIYYSYVNDLNERNKKAGKPEVESVSDVVDSLLKEDLDTLDDILKKYQKEKSPLSLDTFIYNHKQNMTGGALIGIYANNTTMQAKYQNTRLAIKENFTFMLNGRKIQSLNSMQTQIGNVTEWVSKNCAEFSAASVDNVKDPVLADLLQNTKTAKIAGFMLRAGMSIEEVGLMFTQPLVRECIETYGDAKYYNLEEVITKYIDRLKSMEGGVDINLDHIRELGFTSNDLLKNIIMFNHTRWDDGMTNVDDTDIRDIYALNIQSAILFTHISKMADILGNMTQSSRADSPNGALARSIAMMKNQIHKVDKLMMDARQDDFPFVGTEDMMRNDFISPDMSIDEMRERLNGAAMPMLQAFHSLGIDFGRKLTSRYFAQLNPYIDMLVDQIYRNSRKDMVDDSILETFYKDLVTFALSKSTTFGDNGNDSFDKKRDYYLYDYPRVFANILTDPSMKRITNLGIFRKMKVENGEIIMERSGRLTPYMRDMLMTDFDSLLYMDDESRKLATDLFMYAYYKTGFGFGPNSFGNFFSTNFITSFPEVTQFLRTLSFDISKGSYFNRFLEQFYANHYNRDGLLPNYKVKGEPFTKIHFTENGNATIPRRMVTNRNRPGGQLYKYVVLDGELYQADIENSNEKNGIYMKVNTHKDSQKVKYNANMTAAEMAEIKENTARVESAKKLNLSSKSAEIEAISEDYDSLQTDNSQIGKSVMNDQDVINTVEGVMGRNMNFSDMLSQFEQGFVNTESSDNNYSPEDGLATENIIRCL